jgi:hypothetical protein
MPKSCWPYPQLIISKENLAELKSGVHCHAPWPDHFGKWLPKRAMDGFIQFPASDKSSQELRITEALMELQDRDLVMRRKS